MCCFFFFAYFYCLYTQGAFKFNAMGSVQIFGKYILPLGGKCYHPAGNANLKLYIP